jgi:hypothetical protein
VSTTVVYAWVLDGIPQIFVTDEALDDAWAVAQGFTETKVGLRHPTNLPCRINLRSLMPEQTPTSIVVDDLDGTLAALFGTAAATADSLITTLEAATDPAPASVRGKHVGTEFIGAAGERREYSCVPGFAVGMRHLGQNEAYANGGAATPISDGPVIWAGRRCALYRVKIIDGIAQTLAAADRIWWGTMRGQGVLSQNTWTFGVLGPDSWLGGNLGAGNFQDGIRALPITELVDDGYAGPTYMLASLDVVDLKEEALASAVLHTYLNIGDPDGSYNPGNLTGYTAIASALNTFLDQVIASTDNGLAFTNNADGNDIRFSTLPGSDGITIRWLRGATGSDGDPFVGNGDISSLTCRLRIFLHEDVWKILGYDVIQQVNTEGGLDAVDHADQYGRFSPVGWPDGYYQGLFYAANAKAMKAADDNDFGGVVRDDYQGGGQDRRWPPLYPGGTFTWSGEVGQEFQLDTADEVLMAGSKARPLLEDPADNTAAFTLGGGVGVVNRAGVLVLEGPYRRRGDRDQNDPADGDAFDIDRERKEGRTIQVIRVCWRATPGGLVSTDADGKPRLVVQEWIPPREVGIDFKPLDGTWGGHRDPPEGANPITARPLIVMDYAEGSDKMTTEMRRILLSTGTAGDWYAEPGFITPVFGLGAPAAYLEAGDNDDGGDVSGDAEEASLGLGIPASMVAAPEVWDAVGSIPGVHLSRCKVVAGVAAKATAIISRMLAPTGIALTYKGGKFTPIDAFTFPTPDEAELQITTELYGLDPNAKPASGIPKQQLRKWAPIDLVKIDGRIEPIGGEYFRKLERSATDPGARYRAQQVEHRVQGDHLVHPLLQIQGGSWQFDIPVRWRQAFSFWGANHSIIPLTLHMEDALELWPGAGVTITDPWLLDTLGFYGVSVATGIVLSRIPNTKRETIALEVMMAAETEWRMWAPSAVVTEYDETNPYRLMCLDDALGDRGGGLDVEGFIEPAYSVEGGDADIEIFEFDGTAWVGGIFGVVSSIGTTPGSTYIELTGALTGGPWNSDRHHIVVLREWGAQNAAWVKRWHAPICAKDGTHTGAQPGIKWRGL